LIFYFFIFLSSSNHDFIIYIILPISQLQTQQPIASQIRVACDCQVIGWLSERGCLSGGVAYDIHTRWSFSRVEFECRKHSSRGNFLRTIYINISPGHIIIAGKKTEATCGHTTALSWINEYPSIWGEHPRR